MYEIQYKNIYLYIGIDEYKDIKISFFIDNTEYIKFEEELTAATTQMEYKVYRTRVNLWDRYEGSKIEIYKYVSKIEFIYFSHDKYTF